MHDKYLYPKVLIAALDWGLGHASRIIPIIEYLKKRNCNIAIASSGNALILLKDRFPDLVCFQLPSYDIEYKKKSMLIEMWRQLPKILKTRNAEHRELQIILKTFNADLIISDNRYGFYSKDIPSVFISHQLQILAPKYLSLLNPILRKLHFKLMSNFIQIWVPDFYGSNSLAGKLSNVYNIPAKVKYIGPLSRFNDCAIDALEEETVLVILSGPEPARTNFEKKIVSQLENFNGKSILLRGLPGDKDVLRTERVEVYNHVDDVAFLEIISKANIVFCRSGYSSIMDMYFLKKRCVFIPTKGQTEQEYLAERFLLKKMFYSQNEDDFDLKKSINMSSKFTGFNGGGANNFRELNLVLDGLLNR